jgi:hypothetical protein
MLAYRGLQRVAPPSRLAVAARWYSGATESDLARAVEVKMPKFYIVDSTLREGEQFSTCEFTKQERVFVAKTLDKLGVDYIEGECWQMLIVIRCLICK